MPIKPVTVPSYVEVQRLGAITIKRRLVPYTTLLFPSVLWAHMSSSKWFCWDQNHESTEGASLKQHIGIGSNLIGGDLYLLQPFETAMKSPVLWVSNKFSREIVDTIETQRNFRYEYSRFCLVCALSTPFCFYQVCNIFKNLYVETRILQKVPLTRPQ